MLIKSADDKTKRLELLRSLAFQDCGLDKSQKEWAQAQFHMLQKGIQGEKDAAHYLDVDYTDRKNCALLHDLRFEVDGEVAQIDHLIINRLFEFFLLETKNFNGNLRINDLGEFTVQYEGQRSYGIPSPLEQSRRHERILKKVLEQAGIAGRVNTKPAFQHVVLVHPKATITRPTSKKFDTSNVIKADLFGSWHNKFIDKSMGMLELASSLINIRSQETMLEWAEILKRFHKPADLLALPAFMARKPQVSSTHPFQSKNPTSETRVSENVKAWTSPPPKNSAQDLSAKKVLKCATCGCGITYPEGQFCWRNERRFGGLQYCREHQKDFK